MRMSFHIDSFPSKQEQYVPPLNSEQPVGTSRFTEHFRDSSLRTALSHKIAPAETYWTRFHLQNIRSQVRAETEDNTTGSLVDDIVPSPSDQPNLPIDPHLLRRFQSDTYIDPPWLTLMVAKSECSAHLCLLLSSHFPTTITTSFNFHFQLCSHIFPSRWLSQCPRSLSPDLRSSCVPVRPF